CLEEGLKPLQLLKWGINKFCRNADDSPQVPQLKNKEYSDYRITNQEWDLLSVLKEVLEVRIQAGLAKLSKWYKAIEATDLYFICIALNPAVKTYYTAKKWDSARHKKGMKAFEARVT
ncbi:hypothetical protein BC629DRAFT_1286108, partial [Irpex lacteus]